MVRFLSIQYLLEKTNRKHIHKKIKIISYRTDHTGPNNLEGGAHVVFFNSWYHWFIGSVLLFLDSFLLVIFNHFNVTDTCKKSLNLRLNSILTLLYVTHVSQTLFLIYFVFWIKLNGNRVFFNILFSHRI